MKEYKWINIVEKYPKNETIIFLKGIIKKIIDGKISLEDEKNDLDMQFLSVNLILFANKIEMLSEDDSIRTIVENDKKLSYDKELDEFLFQKEKRDEVLKINEEVNINELKNPKKLTWDDHGITNTYVLEIGNTRVGIIKTIPEDIKTLSDIEFSIGWKPEYYETVNELFEDDSVKSEYYKTVKDINSFTKAEYDSLVKKNKHIFEESIYRYSSTINEVVKRFGEEGNTKLRRELNLSSDLLKSDLNIIFDEKNGFLENRIKVFIGKNGTGKSHILKELFKKTQQKSGFDSQLYFSFGTYDAVYKKKSNDYSSLNLTEINTFDEFRLIFSEKVLLASKYKQIISFLESTLEKTYVTQDFISYFEALFTEGETIYNLYNKFLKLSTGQKLSVIFILEINVKIKDNSIIFIDELENSLHPNLLNSLLGTIEDILIKYKSYAILSTHSHLVVQSMPSEDIYIFKTNDDLKSEVLHPSTELFGNEFNQILLKIYDIEYEDLYFNKKIAKAKSGNLKINAEKLMETNIFLDYLLGEKDE